MNTYRFRSFDWRPGTSLQKPLEAARLAMVTTAAFYEPDQPPFDESFRGGDFSFREISNDTELSLLRIGHRSQSFDHSGIERDRNLALPIQRFKELRAEGRIGEVNRRHFSFMGSITAPARLLSQTAPEVADRLLQDRVDGVLLTPV